MTPQNATGVFRSKSDSFQPARQIKSMLEWIFLRSTRAAFNPKPKVGEMKVLIVVGKRND